MWCVSSRLLPLAVINIRFFEDCLTHAASQVGILWRSLAGLDAPRLKYFFRYTVQTRETQDITTAAIEWYRGRHGARYLNWPVRLVVVSSPCPILHLLAFG